MTANSGQPTIARKLRELFRHSIVYGLTSALQSLLGFVLLPILTNYYTPEMFGIYSLLLLLNAVAGAIFYLGASSSLGRFYFDEDSEEYRSRAVSTALLINFSGGILLVVLGFFTSGMISEWMFNSGKYAGAVLIGLLATSMNFTLNLMALIVRYEKRSGLYLSVTISGVLTNFLVTYLLLTRYAAGIMAPLYGLLASNLLSAAVLLLMHLHLITLKLERSQVWIFLSFGVQASVAGFLFYILEWVDRLIIKDLLDLSQVGIYSLGYRLGGFMNILVIMPFSLIWAPMRMQYAKNQNAGEFTSRIVSYYTVVGVGIVLLSMLFGGDIMVFFFRNKDYAGAAPVFPVIMFSLMLYGYQGILDFGIYLHRKVYVYIIISVLGIILNVVLNYLLIPVYGYMAAAFITLITYFFTSSLIYLISNRLHPIRMEWSRITGPIAMLCVSYGLVNYMAPVDHFFKIGVAFVMLLLFVFFWLTELERETIRNFLRSAFP